MSQTQYQPISAISDMATMSDIKPLPQDFHEPDNGTLKKSIYLNGFLILLIMIVAGISLINFQNTPTTPNTVRSLADSLPAPVVIKARPNKSTASDRGAKAIRPAR